MANTYTQISIHAVFAVKGRENIIADPWRDDLLKYINSLLTQHAKTLAVGGWKDHIHVFFGLPPEQNITAIMQKIKGASSKWINEKKLVKGKFEWQRGYGAFSHSKSQRPDVIRYIMEQERHHSSRSFKEEYLDMLRRNNIHFEDEYVFEFYT